jgi:hypothetical protein
MFGIINKNYKENLTYVVSVATLCDIFATLDDISIMEKQ